MPMSAMGCGRFCVSGWIADWRASMVGDLEMGLCGVRVVVVTV